MAIMAATTSRGPKQHSSRFLYALEAYDKRLQLGHRWNDFNVLTDKNE